MENKDDIRLLSPEQLKDFFIENQSKYRVDQISDWLWKKGVSNFSQMSNLSDNPKSLLVKKFCLNKPTKIEVKKYRWNYEVLKFNFMIKILLKQY